MGLSFKQYLWLLISPQPSYKLAMLVFAYLVIVLSRVGYHKSITSKPYKGVSRFLVDLWILYMYFIIVFSVGDEKSQPNTLSLIEGQVGVFVGYLVWDLFKKFEYPETDIMRMINTIVCLILSFIILILYNHPVFKISNLYYLLGEYIILGIFWWVKLKGTS